MSLIEDVSASIDGDKQGIEEISATIEGRKQEAERLIGALSGHGLRMAGHPLSAAKQTLEESAAQGAAIGHHLEQSRNAAEAAKGGGRSA